MLSRMFCPAALDWMLMCRVMLWLAELASNNVLCSHHQDLGVRVTAAAETCMVLRDRWPSC